MPPAPTVPMRLDTKPGRRGSPQGRFRRRVRSRGPGPFFRSPSGAEAPSGFPADSPSGPKPWRFVARQLRNRGSGACLRRAVAEARFRLRQVSFGRSLSPARQPIDLRLRPAFRSSRAEARSCPTLSGAEAPSFAGGSAPTFVPLAAGQVGTEVLSRLSGSTPGGLEPWALERSLPLPHPLKGKPAASAWRRLRQPPGPSLDCLDCLVGQEAASLRLWLGRLSTVAGRSSRPRPMTDMPNRFAQADSGCG